MFNRGIEVLLQALPSVEGLTVAEIRRMLTLAWLEAKDSRLGIDRQADVTLADDLRRLATALEVHAILRPELEFGTVQACGFVAAEAIMVAHELEPSTEQEEQYWIFGSVRRFEQIESGLLYLIAGYDANAALAISELGEPPDALEDPERQISQWALDKILNLLRLANTPTEREPPTADPLAPLRTAVRHEIWRRIGTHVAEHLDWLTFGRQDNPESGAALRTLAGQLEDRSSDRARPAAHPDLHHLLLLLATACEGTASRALRNVPPPPDDDGRFVAYQRKRAASRPLLWPAAQSYADQALPGPSAHAVVSVPTGSGKSSVAELAVGQALCRGWVLYLAPTNALVGQIRRHTADVFGPTAVREFVGGAEYTQLTGESFTEIDNRQVLVMTPEKCSLALRQNPEAFHQLAMCVLDEAHLLGELNGRGMIAELVLAEVMNRAPQARIMLMSALVSNPDELATWLQAATLSPSIVVDAPWRPTRTLRAIAGVDRQRRNTAAAEAYARLAGYGPHRKNERFLAPVDLLAGLQGAWRSTIKEDYCVVSTDIRFPLKIRRAKTFDSKGYCRPATTAIAQQLGEEGEKVLAFLPRSKHDSFLAAIEIPGFRDASLALGETVEAFLVLAELELGTESALRPALRKGVAVHTSALLSEEQRASEIAFDKNIATAMFATGTMAQGLNMPATAVIIGGTDIGYDDQADEQQKKNRARSQLLNAIGRAGRAHVAPRSMAIVVPNKLVVLDSAEDARRAVRQAEFLQDEDASSALRSSLDGLITNALSDDFGVEAMSSAEQVAFSFLSFAGGNESDAQGIIGKTWAAHRANARSRAEEIAGSIEAAGQDYIQRAGVPSWLSLAAHQSGLPLPETVSIYIELRARLAEGPTPNKISLWADLLLHVLNTLPPEQLERILPKNSYGSSRLADIYETSSSDRQVGWKAYSRTLKAWMAGKPLIDVAIETHPAAVKNNSRRGVLDPLPRVIAIVSNGFRFGLSLIAGSLVAIVTNGNEHEPDSLWNLPDESMRALNLLPLAIRSGADTPEVLAWIRAGVRTRTAAHTLNGILSPPEGQADDELQRWAFGRFKELAEGAIPGVTTPEQDQIIRALEVTQRAR
ncbi:DEAD/DEAH box helicase [Herbidospora cretacea]|uniref:DEAD/DEAH box helicase n=1 Tax=Herbidospora cretacea TaxID=28444 RepID=UPI0009EEC10E|nr:DEAD/DEAH box helicase [Herbidospora cretacea]